MLKIEQRGNRKENRKRKETKSTSYDLDIIDNTWTLEQK